MSVQSTTAAERATNADLTRRATRKHQSSLDSKVVLDGTGPLAATSESDTGELPSSNNSSSKIQETASGVEESEVSSDDQSIKTAKALSLATHNRTTPSENNSSLPGVEPISASGESASEISNDVVARCGYLEQSHDEWANMTRSGNAHQHLSPVTALPAGPDAAKQPDLREIDSGCTRPFRGSPRVGHRVGVHSPSVRKPSRRDCVTWDAGSTTEVSRYVTRAVTTLSSQACQDAASGCDEKGPRKLPINTCGPASVKSGTCHRTQVLSCLDCGVGKQRLIAQEDLHEKRSVHALESEEALNGDNTKDKNNLSDIEDAAACDSISSHSPVFGVDVTSRLSGSELHSTSECVEVQPINDDWKNRNAAGVLNNSPAVAAEQCYQQVNGASFEKEAQPKGCEFTESLGSRGILKPGTVCRESALAQYRASLEKQRARVFQRQDAVVDERWPNSLLRNGSTLPASQLRYDPASSCPQQLRNGINPTPSNRKRLCKSLSNLTADDLLSQPCSTGHNSCTTTAHPLSSHQSNESMTSKSRIAKLFLGHVRSPQADQDEQGSPQPKKVNKVNGDVANGLRKSKRSLNQLVPNRAATGANNVDDRDSSLLTGYRHKSNGDQATKSSNGSKKVPKLPRSLFPFMRKDRKRQNGAQAARGGPLKASGLSESLADGTDTAKHPNDGITNYSENARLQATATPVVGFRKLKVNATPPRRNVHADYATRVARISRNLSSSDKPDTPQSSPKSPTSSSSSLLGAKMFTSKKLHKSTGDLLAVDPSYFGRRRPPRQKSALRFTAAMTSSSALDLNETPQSGQRPSSFATSETAWCGDVADADVHVGSDARVRRDEPLRASKKEELAKNENRTDATEDHPHPKLRIHNIPFRQDEDHHPFSRVDQHRSFNIELLRNAEFCEQLSFLASLPGPETSISGSKSGYSSLTGTSTPCSAIWAPRCPSGLRLSLASSYASVFTEEGQTDKSGNADHLDPDQVEPNDESESAVAKQSLSLKLRRTQSLCKDRVTPLTLQINQTNRRSVSPSFESATFSDGRARFDGDVHPKKLERRIQSMRDFGVVQPNKPTTPKPRKISCSGSSSSLNRFGFQMSLQNLAVAGRQSRVTTPVNVENPPDAPVLDIGEARQKSSAKNASIRRRMSLQITKAVNRDREDDAPSPQNAQPNMMDAGDLSGSHQQTPGLAREMSSSGKLETLRNEIENEWKRHSIAGLDSEKVKSAMARWSVATSSTFIASGARNTRRKIRPLSEVQNLRWEVHAIPEHNEVAVNFENDESTNHAPRPKSLHLSYSSSVTSECRASSDTYHCKTCSYPHLTRKHHDDDILHRVGLVGSSFSEEDISSTSEEEPFRSVRKTPRSLSVIGGLNALPLSVLHFYPAKYYTEAACSCRLGSYPPTTRPSDNLTPFGHGLHHFFESRPKARGSTTSGISNESGYGTMTRRGGFAKPGDAEDDVFVQANLLKRDENGVSLQNQDVVFVEALWDHVTMDNEELGFKVGDVIRVIDLSNVDWWWGELDGGEGWFPATFVRILVNQQFNEDIDIIITPSPDSPSEDDSSATSGDSLRPTRPLSGELCRCSNRHSNSSVHCATCGRPLKSGPSSPRNERKKQVALQTKHHEPGQTPSLGRKTSLSRDTIRMNVVNEIVSSEKVYVGHLKDVIEGYLSRCRNRPDMFNDELVASLFGNIEKIYEFQKDFCTMLEAAVNRSCVHESQLGSVFVQHREGFAIYSEYCNNHPQALAQLSQLLTLKKYVHFLEACRLLQKMIDIPLDGFLLTPVQKICKYPLQLAELLKYTHHEHPDYEPVKAALEVMKDVARMINERKRQMENIKKISLWQSTILNWQDDDVLLQSRELVHSGEIYTLSEAKNRPKLRMAFLFDHQLIICKKDILRRDLLYYKRRINLDESIIVELDAGSPRTSTGGDSLSSAPSSQRGWKMTDTNGKAIPLLCKTEDEYQRWAKAFQAERKLSETKRIGLSPAEDALAKELLQQSVSVARKLKETGSTRAPLTYRQRVKMATQSQGAIDISSKQKNLAMNSEKSAGFFSNMAGRLTPFRRTTARESSVVF